HLSYEISPISLSEVVASVVPLVEMKAQQREISLEITESRSECRALADRPKVEQILLNLLSNAIKFTNAKGTVSVACHATPTTASISVVDTGIGVPVDKQETIFEPFVQLGRSLSSAHEGTGLGLAISRDLARAMDGNLTAVSKVGTGSTFTLTLPRRTTPQGDARARRSKSG